jgi:cell division protein FtsQ
MQISLPFESIKVSGKRNSYRHKQCQMRQRLCRTLQLFLFLLGFAGLSLLCVAGYRTLLTSPLLQVTTIQVSGYHRLDPQSVIQQAKIPSDVNILSLDLDGVNRRLRSHPWIAAALISREIPDRIRIEIKEREPVALVRGHQFFLMDYQGVCFASAVPSEYGSLPIITGLDPETLAPGCIVPRKFTVLIEDFYKESNLKMPWRLVSEIRWDKNAGVSIFTVQGGIQVDLGSDNFGPKMARLEKVLRYLEEKGLQKQLRGIDLSHGNRVFVRGKFQVRQQDRPQKRGA